MSFVDGTSAYVRHTTRLDGTNVGMAQIYVMPGSVHIMTHYIRKVAGRPAHPEVKAYEGAREILRILNAQEYSSSQSGLFTFVSTEMTRDEFERIVGELRTIEHLRVVFAGAEMGVSEVLDTIVARLTPIGNHRNP